eukprot:TRINITY_DN7688_c0_g1_i1.p1 TRINITY_DN7688_c0_g1~~TRINITY_DN7688_c0_g1_i1.p1  ORF type:complete len:207 (+),score=69.57 TRINITY_DN7688_c0_g1_i1:119-739(+)
MSLFEVYESAFREGAQAVKSCLEQDAATSGSGDLAAAREGAESADEALKSMDTEMSGKFELKVKVTQYKKELESLKRDLDALQRRRDRDALLSGAHEDSRDEPTDMARVVASQNTRIDRQGDKIAQARQIVAETERTGEDVVMNLRRQGEQMEQTMETLDTTNSKLTAARQLVGKLRRRVIQNKILLYSIIGALILMIVILIAVSI